MKNDLKLGAAAVDHLLSTAAIRERAARVFQLCLEGGTAFAYHPEKLQPTVDFTLEIIRRNYPDLKIPFHSRWGHFRAGKIDRAAQLDAKLAGLDPLEKARVKLDLVITSVLLDAGAGPDWSYAETESGRSFARSEGLGVASYHMFLAGAFSADRKSPRADRDGLKAVTAADLEKHFQVSPRNPLVGVDGRVQLLNNLGRAVENKTLFGGGRPGHIVDYVIGKYGREIPATGLLRAVLDGLGVIWPGRLSSDGVNLGDVWNHPKIGLVPIHKLSQWMTYSLIEPIEEAGCKVTGVDQLTGLAEYRNGGLLLDTGLLTFRRPDDATKNWTPDSELIVEWRALTVHLLDLIGAGVQKALGRTPADFPLAKVLEGGTWWAGRALAQEKRGGQPPLNIVSDGTVF